VAKGGQLTGKPKDQDKKGLGQAGQGQQKSTTGKPEKGKTPMPGGKTVAKQSGKPGAKVALEQHDKPGGLGAKPESKQPDGKPGEKRPGVQNGQPGGKRDGQLGGNKVISQGGKPAGKPKTQMNVKDVRGRPLGGSTPKGTPGLPVHRPQKVGSVHNEQPQDVRAVAVGQQSLTREERLLIKRRRLQRLKLRQQQQQRLRLRQKYVSNYLNDKCDIKSVSRNGQEVAAAAVASNSNSGWESSLHLAIKSI